MRIVRFREYFSYSTTIQFFFILHLVLLSSGPAAGGVGVHHRRPSHHRRPPLHEEKTTKRPQPTTTMMTTTSPGRTSHSRHGEDHRSLNCAPIVTSRRHRQPCGTTHRHGDSIDNYNPHHHHRLNFTCAVEQLELQNRRRETNDDGTTCRWTYREDRNDDRIPPILPVVDCLGGLGLDPAAPSCDGPAASRCETIFYRLPVQIRDPWKRTWQETRQKIGVGCTLVKRTDDDQLFINNGHRESVDKGGAEAHYRSRSKSAPTFTDS